MLYHRSSILSLCPPLTVITTTTTTTNLIPPFLLGCSFLPQQICQSDPSYLDIQISSCPHRCSLTENNNGSWKKEVILGYGVKLPGKSAAESPQSSGSLMARFNVYCNERGNRWVIVSGRHV